VIEVKPGDRVQDCIWDGRYVGTVTRVDANRRVFVRWDGYLAEDQLRPHQIARIDEEG
jgi:cytidylate kinase